MFGSGKQQPPAFAQTDFAHFFPIAKEWKHTPGNGPRADRYVQSFVSVGNADRHLALEAKPTDEVVSWCNDNMLSIKDTGPIHFNLILFADGTAHLYAEYTRIIGTRLLARLDAATVPLFGRAFKAS